jgi:hypothetical protein
MAKKIYRVSHGHYGGYYVEVPAEHFREFKEDFPKGTFPRKVRVNKISSRTDFGAAHFNKTFPKSKGTSITAFFSNRSKGAEHLVPSSAGPGIPDPMGKKWINRDTVERWFGD